MIGDALACIGNLPICVFDQLIGWAQTWPFWVVVACIVFVLGFAYRVAGWPGVLVVASGGAYFLGRYFGRRDDDDQPFENGGDDPVRPPRAPRPPSEAKFPRLRGWLDRLRPRR